MRAFLFGGCLLLGAFSTSATAGEASPAGISVEGEGEVRVVPDRARLSLAAEQLDAELGRAETAVNAIVRQYLAAASAIGVEARHLQSTAVQIQPETVWNEKTRRNELVGYRVRRDLQVTVTDLAQLGDLLSAATRAGITYVSPPQLEASQAAEHGRAALARAAEDAQAQARVLAESLGRRLGPARQIDAIPAASGGPMPMVKAMMAADSLERAEPSMGLSTGEIVFRSRVRVRFDFAGP